MLVEIIILVVVGLFIAALVVWFFLWGIERLKDHWSRSSFREWKKNRPPDLSEGST